MKNTLFDLAFNLKKRKNYCQQWTLLKHPKEQTHKVIIW